MGFVFFQVRMPPDLRQQLKEKAARLGMSVNALILQALWAIVQA